MKIDGNGRSKKPIARQGPFFKGWKRVENAPFSFSPSILSYSTMKCAGIIAKHTDPRAQKIVSELGEWLETRGKRS